MFAGLNTQRTESATSPMAEQNIINRRIAVLELSLVSVRLRALSASLMQIFRLTEIADIAHRLALGPVF